MGHRVVLRMFTEWAVARGVGAAANSHKFPKYLPRGATLFDFVVVYSGIKNAFLGEVCCLRLFCVTSVTLTTMPGAGAQRLGSTDGCCSDVIKSGWSRHMQKKSPATRIGDPEYWTVDESF